MKITKLMAGLVLAGMDLTATAQATTPAGNYRLDVHVHNSDGSRLANFPNLGEITV